MPDNQFTFTTSNPTLAASIMALMNGNAPVQASAPVTAAPAAPVVPPAAPAAPAAPATPPAAPAAPTAPVAAAQPHGQAPEGWTIQHITGALAALGQNAAKGGPAAVAQILSDYGAKQVSQLDPAKWPEIYARATA